MPALQKAESTGPKPYLLELTPAGFCSQFNRYLYSYMWAQKNGGELQVYDLNNSISPSYALLRASFRDTSGVKFVSDMPPGYTSLKGRQVDSDIFYYLSSLPIASLRAAAQHLFQLSESAEASVQAILDAANTPPVFDLTVHIRSGDKISSREMDPIPLQSYITAIKNFQRKSGKKTLSIFLMSDNEGLATQLRQRADPSWSFFSFPSTLTYGNGYTQGEFNRFSRRAKETAYFQFLAELALAQNIPAFIGTFSSHVSRFLYLTCSSIENFTSIDVPKYTPL